MKTQHLRYVKDSDLIITTMTIKEVLFVHRIKHGKKIFLLVTLKKPVDEAVKSCDSAN